MKAKFIKGTTLHGKPVNGGDVLDLDEREYNLFVKVHKDAEPFIEPVKAKAEPVAAEPATEAPIGDKKGKK